MNLTDLFYYIFSKFESTKGRVPEILDSEIKEAHLESIERSVKTIQERLKSEPKWLRAELDSILSHIEELNKL